MRVARARDARTVGAIAGLAVAVAFGAFGIHVGGDVPMVGLPAVVSATLVVSVLPGWIIGPRLDRSVRSAVLGTIAYSLLATAIWVPIAVIGMTAMDAATGPSIQVLDLIGSVAGGLAYGYLSSPIIWPLAIPFAVAWTVAYMSIRWSMASRSVT